MQRIEKDEYPVAAVREMILNALVHRSYPGSQTQIRLIDSSFSVWNDGGLPEGITEEDLLKVHRSKPRNPLIADVCFKAGYIDAWGRGTLKIVESCKGAGLPKPVLKEEQGGFVVTISKDWFSPQMLSDKGLNERQIGTISYMKKKGFITNHEYTVMHGISDRTALRDLRDMLQKKLIQKEGQNKGTRYMLIVG
jgi:ATP-dependent DNA helicase RecG